MKIIKRVLGGLLALVLVVSAIVIVRTLTFVPSQELQQPEVASTQPDEALITQHLAEAIRIPTISNQNVEDMNVAVFNQFGEWLQTTYPAVFEQLDLTMLNDYTYLFHWKGKQASEPGVLFSAHYDVVPVNADTLDKWHYEPFSGTEADGYIWGRGALDDKSAVIALMESVNLLLAKDYQPASDIYIALTHDEEIGSRFGAAAVTDYFRDNQIPLAWSLDEGSFVLSGIIPGVAKNVASINLAEKGYLTLELVAHGVGGHSSMPPQETAVGILASAIVKLKNNPVPGGLDGISESMYLDIAKHMGFSQRMMFANLWLFKPLIENVLSGMTTGNAMLRTTIAPTMLSGSVKDNVLPTMATAKINFRLHPRDTVDSVMAWAKQSINDDRVELKVVNGFEPSAIANVNNPGFEKLAKLTKKVYGDVITTPGLTIAATDSHYYSTITDSYRFNPMTITQQDLAGFHGINERISKKNMVSAVQFYTEMMQP